MALIKINDYDNVAVAIDDVTDGSTCQVSDVSITAKATIKQGHKVALVNIKKGENVIKYGFPIGHATEDIKAGEWIHSHNLKTNLGDILHYEYQPGQAQNDACLAAPKTTMFKGYRRENGKVGVRNEVWIISTVGCINRVAQLIAQSANVKYKLEDNFDGVYEFTHPYGCSQLGDDHANTQRILADLVNHPNAAAVLVLGLGCENNNIEEFKKVIGKYDSERVHFLVAQEVEDEVEQGVDIIGNLIKYASKYKREDCPVSELTVGLKCGGSDGLSGITANPLVGVFSDKIVACGGSTVLTEVPEMFGAETILMNRAISEDVFNHTVSLVNDFKKYYERYNQPIYENPSPGNKKGGITTLEEKSLGCTQKGGRSPVTDVIEYAGTVRKKGLTLLSAPGNDIVATTALVAAGCQLVLFTTGRGTPLGTAVPTVKIATNSDIFTKKRNWLDFNAGTLLTGESMDAVAEQFYQYILQVASGSMTQAEKMGFREIAIFKDGVTL